ncbi:hypothetical protein HU200_002165 [Digitaria exilis]|uniref:Peptidase M24 domain-containing protein n=1 Tax=Digitaria exilis TaxID=1010633 RepID=A0A835FXM4_9POAL|nr:hypothetical protein HU200_002165 [Digitaria exilis]
MARPSPPRLLSSFLGDRLALSARPLAHRSAAPGAFLHHLHRCHVAAPMFQQRVGPGAITYYCEQVPFMYEVLKFAGTLVKPGITTDEIDKAVHQMIIDNGAYPSPLGYCGYPKSVCTSVNECICHGIPDSRPLEDGDIINIDVTIYLNGYHGDTSATFLCGDVDDEAKKLVQVMSTSWQNFSSQVTKECLDKAISICAPGVEIKRIGRTIQYTVCRNNEWGRMVLNQTFTIAHFIACFLSSEPMLTLGSINPVMWSDDWTAVTEDGSLSAQFEHTILITKDGPEILTQC